MYVLGITGGIGCGKSSVCKYIEETYDAKLVMADDVGKEVCEPGKPALEKLRNLFDAEFFLEDGSMNRKKIASIVFADPEMLRKMNEIIHPEVKDEILRRIENAKMNGCRLFVIEAALFIEAGYASICDEFWYIYVDRETRIKRLGESRGMTPEQVENVMKRQLSEKIFRDECDKVIDNSGDFELTKRQISEALAKVLGENK